MTTTTHRRRLGAALLAPVLAGGALLATAPPASAAPSSYAYSAARWLEDQLDDGLVHNEQYDVDDHGLSLDVFFTLQDLGTRTAAQERIVDALAADPGAYVGAGEERYAGATGKLLRAAQLAGRDTAAFGGLDLVERLEGLVAATGPAAGRATDASEYGDYSNTIGQTWVARSLVGADSDLADEAVGYLIKQQCDDGSFRIQMADAACTGGTGTVDATALSLRTLLEADAAEVADVDAAITEARAWLRGEQADDGSFGADDGINTNSTGLAAAALVRAGDTGAAGSAAAWLIGKQVTDAVAEDTALRNEIGAIAFDAAGLEAGKADGIPVEQRDQWIRATAQAAVGVDAVLPRATLDVSAPSAVQPGRNATVRVAGLAPGETFTVRLASSGRATGRADAKGAASVGVKAPSSSGTWTASVTGSRTVRAGSATVSTLGAKKLGLTLRSKSVARGRTQGVTVTGLAKGERVRVKFKGAWLGETTAPTGTYKKSFAVGSKKGTYTVVVWGAFSHRQASATFTVK